MPRWHQISFVFMFASLAGAALLSSPGTVSVVPFAVLGAFFLWTDTVRIEPDGVVLYRLWRLQWTNVGGAKYCKVLGLPYAKVKRRKGWFAWLPWWIPLYFVGEGDLRETLASAAPAGNPLRLMSSPK